MIVYGTKKKHVFKHRLYLARNVYDMSSKLRYNENIQTKNNVSMEYVNFVGYINLK